MVVVVVVPPSAEDDIDPGLVRLILVVVVVGEVDRERGASSADEVPRPFDPVRARVIRYKYTLRLGEVMVRAGRRSALQA
jgi:hypothetical protein